MKKVLVIAASDPCGGAGVEADVKVLTAHHVNALTAISALTFQDSEKVHGVKAVHPDDFRRVLEVVRDDRKLDGVKIGALAGAEHVQAVVDFIQALHPRPFVVLDPVLIATSGAALLAEEALPVLRDSLLPLADVITPNLAEARALSGVEIKDQEKMKDACLRLVSHGASASLITGGHLKGDSFDLLFHEGEFIRFPNRLIDREFHGTGCALASAIASRLAQGFELVESIRLARAFLELAMAGAVPGKGSSWLLDLTVTPKDK
ncbi:MAG: bifunctional hydroxymethylpyrimidine kinase/phosphomethylpyrimidine kinase [bacterium]